MSIVSSKKNGSGILNKVFLYFLFISYLYSIHYRYMPLNSTALIGIVGILVYISNDYVRSILFRGHAVRKVLSLYIPVVIVTLISLLANSTGDMRFVKWAITGVFYFFGGATIIYLTKKVYGYIDGVKLVDMMIIAAVFQLSLSLIMWAFPSLSDELFTLLQTSSVNEMIFEKASGMRLIGFGAYFFGSAVIHGFILIMIAIYYNKVRGTKSLIWMMSFIYIFIIGLMMARSIIFGAILALIIFLVRAYKSKKLLISTSKVVFAVFFALLISLTLSSSVINRFQTVIEFGFELFINERETGHLRVKSMNSLDNMYIYPDNIKTWVIGDGKWDKSNGGYYKDTDVGVCRMIFYFGLIGLFAYLIFNIRLLKTICRRNSWGTLPIIIFLAYISILNYKGFTDIFLLVIPFYFVETTRMKEAYIIMNSSKQLVS